MPKKETTKTITFGNVNLEINPEYNEHVPTNSKNYIDHQNVMKTLALSVRENKQVLIIGESGLGKTASVRYLAQATNNPLRRINLNGGTTADELIGRNGIDEKGTYWIDGILTECMRKGYWVVLDEINAALAEVTFLLHSVLDDDGYLVLTEKPDREIVRKHPNFRIFATCNPDSYAGTKEMNTALLSRFQICISAQFPSMEIEKEIVKEHLGETIARNIVTDKLLNLANEIRQKHKMDESRVCYNTRDIINTLSLCHEYSPIEAYTLSFLNKLPPEQREAERMVAIVQLPNRIIKKNEVVLKGEEDIDTGKNYIVIKKNEIKYTHIKKEDAKTKDIGSLLNSHEKYHLETDDTFEIKSFYYPSQFGETPKMKDGEKPLAIRIGFKNKRGKEGIIDMRHEERMKELENSMLIVTDDK